MQFGGFIFPAEIAVYPYDIGRRFEAPASIVHPLCREIDGAIAEPSTVLRIAVEMTERAALPFALEAPIGETVLHLQTDRTAEGVQPEHRVVGPHIGTLDRVGRDQVPVHRVAKGFIEPDAIHINGD